MGAFVFLSKGSLAFEPGRARIPADHYAEFIEAGQLLDRAREEASRLVQEGRNAAEAARKDGYDKGVEEAKHEIALQMVEDVGRRVAYLSSVEDKLVSILLSALDQILGEMDQREVVAKVLKNALNVLRGQTAVTIRVAPDKSAYVNERLDELHKTYPEMTILQVRPDAALSGTACILESEVGVVDASLDVQLTAIREAFERNFALPGSKDQGKVG
jgi:type III secretion protein L